MSDSVEAVRKAASESDLRAAQKLDDALAALGWNPDQTDDEHWTMRNDPLVLSASSMPRLTLDMLPTAPSGRIDSVVYDVDVTGARNADDGPIDLFALRLP